MSRRRKGVQTRTRPPLTAAQLQRGWSAPGRTRIRLARPGEAEQLDRLLRYTGVPLEDQAATAIEDGTVAAALIEALRGGRDALVRPLAEAASAGDPSRAFPALSLALVAADRDEQIVAGLLAIPPGGLMLQAVQSGLDPYQSLTPAFSITKIKGVAVDEQHRGAGIGEALLRRCVRLFFQLDFYLAYGQFSVGRGLENYYPRHGFDVLDPRTGVSLDAQFGLPMVLRAEPGEQLFIRWRGNPDRVFWEHRA